MAERQERACVFQSVQTLTDTLIESWLSIASCPGSEAQHNERALVNRVIELLSWGQIHKALQEMADSSESSGQQHTSIINWKAVLTGWTTSIKSHDLSDLSVKLLKLVVLSERIKTCHRGQATSETYTDIAKLLFCISKFAELRDTDEQMAVVGLCAEAKSLEMLFVIQSEEVCSQHEEWDRRAEVFAFNAKKALLSIIHKRFEIPPMFASCFEKLAKNLNTKQLPSLLLPQQQQHQVEIVGGEAMGQDHHLKREDEDKVDDAKDPDNEAAVLDKMKFECSEVTDVEMKDEEDKTESDDAVPSSLNGVVDRSIDILQMPFVSETVQWSDNDNSLEPQLETDGGDKGVRVLRGSKRVRWSEEEVEFLKEGVGRFGIGNWKTIRQTYPFNSKRTNLDLRDKWRNLQKKT